MNRYHTKISEHLDKNLVEMNKQLVAKLVSVLDGLLKKLSRYDEGSFFSSILSVKSNLTSVSTKIIKQIK
jgi:calcium-dependent secretion activator